MPTPEQRLYDLRVAREQLQDNLFRGVLTFRDQNGELVAYMDANGMKAALTALDAEIALLQGRVVPSSFHFSSTKGT